MSSRLTTVATFDLAAKAEVAKNVLDEAGIPAVLADAEIVAMDWLIANAVGGIKVQVREEDAERAAAVLDERLGAEAGLAAEGLDEDELTRQALADGPEEPEPLSEEVSETDDAEDDTGPVDRDGYAGPALLAACLSVFVIPLYLYALYLWLHAAFGPGPLSARGRWLTAFGGLALLSVLAFWVAALLAALLLSSH
jgi:hypothetical protein